MSDQQSSRRNFFKILGVTAGATIMSKSGLASFTDRQEILKLNPQQQEFMIRYGKWMDEFTDVIRIQQKEPDNIDNHKLMIALTEKVAQLQPELTEFLKDSTFAVIYKASIERMSKEIQ